MAEIENTATIRVVADASGVEAGLRPAVDAARRAEQAVSQVGNGAATSSRNVEAGARNIVAAIQRTTVAMEAGGRQTAAYYEAMGRQRGIDPAVLAPYIAQLRAVEQAQARTAASAGASAGQISAAMRTVPAQFTDIVTAIQGGQRPLTVLLQQGGQLRDQFGSAGVAARALGGYILGLVNPYTIAAGAVIGLAAAYKSGAEEVSAYAKALALTGNAAGATADQLNELARQVSAVGGNRGAAAEAITALAATGQVSVDNLKQFGSVAADVQRVIGRSVSDTAADFAKLGKAPLSALSEINDKYHFITAATYAQVKALQDQGRAAEAADVAQKAYADGINTQRQKVMDSLTDWERGWIRIKNAAGGAVDAVIDFASGRGATNSEKVTGLLEERGKIEENLARARARNLPADVAAYNAELEANKRAINAIRDKDKASKDAAKSEGDAAQATEARNKWLTEGDKYLSRAAQLERDVTKARNEGAAAHMSEVDIEKRVGDIRKSYSDIFNAGIESNIAALKRRDQVADVLSQREVARIQAQRTLGGVSEADAINQTADAEDKAFGRHRALLERELALTKGKANSIKEQSDLEGQIDVLDAQRASRKIQRDNDLLLLADKQRAASEALYIKGATSAATERDSILEQIKAQREQNEQIGLTQTALGDLIALRLENTAAQKDETAAALENLEPGNSVAQSYREQADALRKLAQEKRAGAVKQVGKQATDDLDKFFDPAKAQSFGDALRTSFGSAGDAISKLTGSLQQFGIKQAEIAKARKDADAEYKGSNDYTKYLERVSKINEQSTKNQLANYGDMANAAAGFFDEHSRGYQTLQTASQVFHAAELAMTLAELVPKGISAVLSQGQGDPYSAFGRMAAMAAIVTGLGVAIGGVSGGSGASAKDRQAAQGTGSVLGDTSAKSESISKSLDLVEKNTYQDLAVSNSMLTQLRQINSGINGLGNVVTRSIYGGATATSGLESSKATTGVMPALLGTGTLFGSVFGSFASWALSKVSRTKTTVQDQGLSIDPASLAKILQSGVSGSSYTDVNTKKSLFGFNYSSKDSTLTDGLPAETLSQLTQVVAGIREGVASAVSALGEGGDDFTAKLDSFVVNIGQISLKGLTGDEIQKTLETAFSKLGDDIATYAVGGLSALQKVGEGTYETLTRIATEYQTVDVVFDSFGKSFGAVGLASVAARDELVQLAGGLDKFTSAGEFFLKNFFSEDEQAAALKKRIDPTLSQYGLSTEGADASKVFRDFIVGLDTTTEAGAQAYTALMTIAPAFKTVTDAASSAADALAKAAADALQAMKDAASSLLGGVDGSYSVLQKVVGREKDLLQARITAEQAAVTRLQGLSQSISSTLDSIKVPGSEAFSRRSAQAEIGAALASTKAGGSLSDAQIASLKKALSTVTQDSTKQFGSREAYLYDLLTTRNDIAQLGDVTDDQLSTEQASLDQLTAQSASLDAILKNAQDQIDELKGLSTIGLSIEDALHGLELSISGAKANPIVNATAGITDAYSTYLDRAPDADGLAYYQNWAANGGSMDAIANGIATSIEAQIEKAYKDTLGRNADAGGMSFYMDTYSKSGGNIAEIIADLQKSDEYKKLHPFAVGTNYVPKDMPAYLHEGEAVIPAADNRALMQRLSSPSDNNAALVGAVKDLTLAVAQLKEEKDGMAKDMAIMADAIKSASTGGPLRVKVVNN